MHSIIVSLEIFSIIHLPHKYIPVTIQAQLSDRICFDKCTKFKMYIMTTGTQKQRGMFYVCFYILRYIDIYQGTNRDKNAT